MTYKQWTHTEHCKSGV